MSELVRLGTGAACPNTGAAIRIVRRSRIRPDGRASEAARLTTVFTDLLMDLLVVFLKCSLMAILKATLKGPFTLVDVLSFILSRN